MVSPFNEELAAVCKNEKWGYVNTKGELIIPCIYEYANDFSEGLACVSKDGKEGFINKNGEIVIPLKFENCGVFSEGLAYAGDKRAITLLILMEILKFICQRDFSSTLVHLAKETHILRFTMEYVILW